MPESETIDVKFYLSIFVKVLKGRAFKVLLFPIFGLLTPKTLFICLF